MKQVIEGELYNTETALRLGHYWNNKSYSDFDCVDETLYKTNKGKYFLQRDNGCRAGGVGIIPLDEGEARHWMELHCDIIKAFGEPEEA